MSIEDWEIGALYWNCLRVAEGDEAETIRLVEQKYSEEFLSSKDIHLFLGTTLKYHRRRVANPWIQIGEGSAGR